MDIRRILLSVLALLFVSVAQTSFGQDGAGLKHGKLSNGLTYYIYSTADMPGEVNFYLLQNVGAIVESDKENGLAHFLEHMAFEGTEHFPQGVMKHLRDRGVYTFDAYTRQEETEYHLYSIPTSNRELTDAALLVMKDWCNGISITPKDVEKQRSIIVEEWRQRNDVNKRLQDHMAPLIYNHTKYASRNVIGSEEVLKSFSAKELKSFYQNWYRPDLQCVVIIGDIDAQAYEDKVKSIFSSIKAPKSAPKREKITIPDHSEPLYSRFVDRENVSNSFGIYQRFFVKAAPHEEGYVRHNLFNMIFNQLISNRIGMIRNEGAEHFIAATATCSPLVKRYAQNAWDVVPYKGQELQALEQILSVREAVRRDGFAEEEFEEIQEAIYNDLNELLKADKVGTLQNIMEVYKQNFLNNVPIQPFRAQLQDNAEAIVEMSVEDLNDWVKTWMDDSNIAFITYSNDEKEMNITKEQFEATLAKVKAAPTLSFARPEPIQKLIDYDLKPGKIVSEKVIAELDAKEWKLSNGGKVLYKYIPEMKDEVFFVASAMGGNSVIKANDLPSNEAMRDLLMRSGVYKYSRNQLAHWLSDKKIDLNISITDYVDNLGGLSSVRSAENMLAYAHLILCKQRFDESVFEKYKERQLYINSTQSISEMTKVQDQISKTLFPISEHNPERNEAYFKRMNLDDVKRLYDEKFGNAGHFTYCVAGNLEESRARTLVEKYIASLPGVPGTQPRTYQVRDLSSSEKEIVKTFEVDVPGDIGQVELSFVRDVKLSPKEEKVLEVLESLLQQRMFEELREKEAGTYSVGVQASYNKIPTPSVSLSMRFETERSKVDFLKQRTYQILDEIKTGKLPEQELKKIVFPMMVEQKAAESADEKAEENPMIWIALLNLYMETGDVKSPDASPKEAVVLEDIKVQDVAQLLNKVMSDAKKRDIVVKSLPLEKREWVH